jgi:catechol 2,3-dioxygenase-like lactoylglutathione lyase family enzyme
MPGALIEHVNITVSDPARTARLLMDLFDWTVRWEGTAASGGHTIHVGSESGYIAVYAAPGGPRPPLGHGKGAPLNHIGVEVADLDATEARAKALGLHPFNHGSYSPGRRFYLFDPDGVEWEIVSYAVRDADLT